VVHFRGFRNTDPPRLVELWNECFTGRGAVQLRTPEPLEQRLFAKWYFEPAGLIIAEEGDACIGLAHAGFGPGADSGALDHSAGVVCLIGVRPSFRRRGIGSELLKRCEDYLRQRGAQTLFAGPHTPLDPFCFGLYGGSQTSGFLTSDPAAEPFLLHHEYQVSRRTLVMQRRCGDALAGDVRAIGFRSRYEVRLSASKSLATWWQNCQFNLLEPQEFLLAEKKTDETVARALIWEMEGFSWRWQQPAVGLLALEVKENLRRQGFGRFFVGLLLRHLQEQFFEIVEIQVNEADAGPVNFFRRLGFTQVDVGQVFKKCHQSLAGRSVSDIQ
jgi:ribosomal protein S18 acetylase RimI-like enzyme